MIKKVLSCLWWFLLGMIKYVLSCLWWFLLVMIKYVLSCLWWFLLGMIKYVLTCLWWFLLGMIKYVLSCLWWFLLGMIKYVLSCLWWLNIFLIIWLCNIVSKNIMCDCLLWNKLYMEDSWYLNCCLYLTQLIILLAHLHDYFVTAFSASCFGQTARTYSLI